jgi:hypothetical protein
MGYTFDLGMRKAVEPQNNGEEQEKRGGELVVYRFVNPSTTQKIWLIGCGEKLRMVSL